MDDEIIQNVLNTEKSEVNECEEVEDDDPEVSHAEVQTTVSKCINDL